MSSRSMERRAELSIGSPTLTALSPPPSDPLCCADQTPPSGLFGSFLRLHAASRVRAGLGAPARGDFLPAPAAGEAPGRARPGTGAPRDPAGSPWELEAPGSVL